MMIRITRIKYENQHWLSMKRSLLVLALIPLATIAQVSSKTNTKPVTKTVAVSKGFTIEGKLDGYTEGTDIVMYKNGENVEMMRTKLANGKFVLKGSVSEPVL